MASKSSRRTLKAGQTRIINGRFKRSANPCEVTKPIPAQHFLNGGHEWKCNSDLNCSSLGTLNKILSMAEAI
jgi:hypothetical protein